MVERSQWLRELARRLVRDPAIADDLVQDTWCAALGRRPDDLRDERGWLATLLANFARSRSRSDRARRKREEHCSRGEMIDGPDALVERAETQRKLLEALLALDEPNRSTLIARYVEGRTPEEIAASTRVNASTVRTRLQRGLSELRAHLARRDGSTWMLALAPLCRSDLGAGSAATAATGSVVATGVGALIMSTSFKLALTAAACVLAAWLVWREDARIELSKGEVAVAKPERIADLEGDSPPAVRVSAARTLPAESPAAIHAASTPSPARAADSSEANVAKDELEVIVRRSGLALPGAHVWIAECLNFPELAGHLDGHTPIPDPHVSATTDRDGRAVFQRLKSEENHLIGLEPSTRGIPSQRIAATFARSGKRYIIDLGTSRIRGRVFDAQGRPSTHIPVCVSLYGPSTAGSSTGGDASFSTLVTTDVQGRYEARDLPGGRCFVLMDPDGVFDGGGLAHHRGCELREGEELVLDFGSPNGAAPWTGVVRNRRGEELAGPGQLELRSAEGDDLFSTPVDEHGRFEVAVVAGTWHVMARLPDAPQSGFDLGTVTLSGARHEGDLVLAGARLSGSVRNGATHALIDGSSSHLLIGARPRGHDYPAAVRSVFVDAAGRYALDGLEPGTWIVTAHPLTISPGGSTEVVVREGETFVALDLVVGRP